MQEILKIFNELFQIQDLGIIDSHISLLVCGNGNLDYETSVIFLAAVQKSITNSCKFT